ncbi:carbohydrate ABC transporter membrane protein 2, CUT1 family [Glycomyces sambucus]|uniref:Carbohydrate ABC transporter membrane protein 2, CUT1 family n=1 Tax=Glycomyces sambucus TaxID=380244 RepID=A0A1G9LA29_9ACTN|nr:carbohydrate ABC transporter permease [Glycomyces sambucus]SDL58623.1 carbohydrate ABC transporter membrane protein 2, CUT1 family [Glycomyces sambucus]
MTALQTRLEASEDAPRAAKRRRRPRVTPGSALVYFAAFALALLWLVPFLWALTTSFKPETEASLGQPIHWIPREWSLEGYRILFERGEHVTWMVNSTVVSTIVTALTLGMCVLAAYGFSRLDFPGKKVVYGVVLAGIMVPAEALIIPLFDVVSALRLVDTYWGLALPQTVAPVMIFILKRFFDAIPRDYEEAARIDGAGHLRVLRSVILPLSGPILAAVGIFTFIGSWNNFLWPLLVANDPSIMTLPVGLGVVARGYGLLYAQNMAAAVLGALPLLIVFLIFQKQIVKGVAGVGLK